MFQQNPMTLIDAYKIAHYFQMAKGVKFMYENFTPRFDKYSATKDGKMLWIGNQMFIRKILVDLFQENFFDKPKEEVCGYVRRRFKGMVGFDVVIEHIEMLHDLGYLPVSIKALPEGTLVNMGIPCMTMVNTDERFAWLPGYLEDMVSNEQWKTCTAGSIALKYRQIIEEYAKETGCSDIEIIPGSVKATEFQGHDFSLRGLVSWPDAQMVGLGHLASFKGSDNIPSVDSVEYYYHADCEKEVIGCSIPATEHSVTSLNILQYEDKYEGEKEFIRRNISEVFPKGAVGMVNDTFQGIDSYMEMLEDLKPEIMGREGKLVTRPDSGDPVESICGINVIVATDGKTYRVSDVTLKTEAKERDLPKLTYVPKEGARPVSERERKGFVECLWDIFGGTYTDKGYKVLDSHIGLIYGDSITLERCEEILRKLKAKGFASINVVLGIGSFTYEYVTRDTYGFAVKATYAGMHYGKDTTGINLYKDPVLGGGMKKSAKGLLRVWEKDGNFELEQECNSDKGGALETVFHNGCVVKSYTLQEVRDNVARYY